MSSLSLACTRSPASPVAPTVATKDGRPALDPSTTWTTRAAPRRFADGAVAPDGCFAWSASRGSAACALGQWPYRRASQPRVVSFLAASGPEPTPLPLQLEAEDPTRGSDPKIAVMSRSRLDVAMRDGSFVDLPPPVLVVANAPPRTFGPFTVSLRHTRVREEKGASGDPYLTAVRVTLVGAQAPSVDESFGPSPCAAPTLKVFALSSTTLLVERACHLVSEGLDDEQVAAWMCDSVQGVCR